LELPLVRHRDYAVFYGWVALAGGSYWNIHWWTTTIMSYLMGGPPRPVVLIGTSIGGPPRLCRILRVGRPSRWFLSDLPLVDHRDYVVSYGWVAPTSDSYWNFHWWATAIISYLTGGSPQPVVLIRTSIGGPPRSCRILRVGRPSRWFLLELPLVSHRGLVISTGVSSQPAVLIETSTGGLSRLRRILRVGRSSRCFLLELPSVSHHDYVVYYWWVAPACGSYWNFPW
jgi:hypothetical protein